MSHHTRRIAHNRRGLGLLNYDPESDSWYDDATGSIPGDVSVTSIPSPITTMSAPATPVSFPSVSEISKMVKDIGGAILTYQQARDIQEINLHRARNNQPLLTSRQMAELSPQVNVGFSPQIRDMLIYGGLALGGVLLFSSMSGRRR